MELSGFRLLSELYSLLFVYILLYIPFVLSFVSVSSRSYILSYLELSLYFFLYKNESIELAKKNNVSVSSRSYILSYIVYTYKVLTASYGFPSPLGVIFSLIKIFLKNAWHFLKSMFPSPLGVIFSLIKN